ncbi:MAG: hypothetical protein AAF934_10260 [Bacteroidota bacterium]
MTDIHKAHEKHIGEALKEEGLAQPSTDFVTCVMQKIEASETRINYTPLIPQTGWLVIGGIALVFIIGSFYFKSQLVLPEWLYPKKLYDYFTIDLSYDITLSKNTMYGILATAAVILLQIPFLKSWHQRTLWRNR